MRKPSLCCRHIRAIRILIAIAAYYVMRIRQMDVKLPSSRDIHNEEQASRQWNKRFDNEIKKFGFNQNADESCVYLKASGSNVTFLILCLYTAELKRMPKCSICSAVGSIMFAVRCTRPDVRSLPENNKFCYTDCGYLTMADDLKSQTGEADGVRKFISRLGVVPSLKKPYMYCDNTINGAIV
ncbi:hypothetical protein Tco_0654026 [Tanacetum coccineum]|uniref:Uncharacterized protein n=1 Tax=Tanacetum coccineum TaxID=301880 RepID=A0ABQ4X280_9ASTR